MITLSDQLCISRCPHCRVDTPNMTLKHMFISNDFLGENQCTWGVYLCARCGGVVTAWAGEKHGYVIQIFPSLMDPDESIPNRAREFLKQAIESMNQPSGSVMLAASAVDSMLKEKGYKEGKLYGRIKKAKEDHLITEEMAKWADQVRLDANEERHADEKKMPTTEDAKRVVDFALALAQFLFVLPSKVNKGIKDAESSSS